MTYTDVWLSELTRDEDPSTWTAAEWEHGNTPAKRVSPLFPPGRRTYEPFSTVRARVQEGIYKGKQVDWGAWAAVMTKQEITELLDELYGTDPTYCGLEHLCEKLAELRVAVQALPDDVRYALVAEEF